MTKIVHRSGSRGFADHGWLKSHHTFSFAAYYDPDRMGFGALRVINDDRVAPGMGFGTHPHRDMEIISIPISGSLRHKDSVGNQTVIKAGEVQIMSAGTGVAHSEYNASNDDDVNFLQIWVLPKKLGIAPRYGQKSFESAERKNRFQTVISPHEVTGSLWINQDAFFSLADVDKNATVHYTRKMTGNGLYVFVIEGEVEAADERLGKRDALGVTGKIDQLTIRSKSDAQVLLMEVPMTST